MRHGMELVHPLEPDGEESPLARARLHRQLTIEETAKRAGITAEEVRWLEEGRVYRFPRPDDALIATALYSTALGLENREARELAGLPVPPQPIERNPIPRLLVIGGLVSRSPCSQRFSSFRAQAEKAHRPRRTFCRRRGASP
jgi:hypothetical protein